MLSIWAEENFLVKILNEILVKVNFATYCLKQALEHSNKVKILTFQLQNRGKNRNNPV